MKKWIAAAALTMAVPMASAKVLISIDGGVGYNLNSLANDSAIGDVVELAGTSTTQPFGLGMEANNGLYGWAKISLPLLPDVKVKYENLVVAGSNTVTVNIPLGPTSIDVAGDVESEFDLTHLDMALTIGLPLPVVDIDLGVNGRSLMGGFTATGDIGGQANQTETVDFTFPGSDTPLILPMGYISAAATIPGIGVKVGGELMTLPLGETNITDWNIKGTWYAPLPTNMLVKLGVEGGYRSFNLTIGDTTMGMDTSELASSIGVSGFFLGATAHF